MKQHDIHNDDALYQQMLAELAPGAEEYNKIVARGKHPASKKRRIIPYYIYVEAACVLFAMIGTPWLLMDKTEDELQTKQVAQIDTMKPEPTNAHERLLAEDISQPDKASLPSCSQAKVHQRRKRVSRHLPVMQTVSPTENSENNANAAPDQELYLALLAEVEAREIQIEQQEQQSMRNLFDELIDNIEQQPNRPELIL